MSTLIITYPLQSTTHSLDLSSPLGFDIHPVTSTGRKLANQGVEPLADDSQDLLCVPCSRLRLRGRLQSHARHHTGSWMVFIQRTRTPGQSRMLHSRALWAQALRQASGARACGSRSFRLHSDPYSCSHPCHPDGSQCSTHGLPHDDHAAGLRSPCLAEGT